MDTSSEDSPFNRSNGHNEVDGQGCSESTEEPVPGTDAGTPDPSSTPVPDPVLTEVPVEASADARKDAGGDKGGATANELTQDAEHSHNDESEPDDTAPHGRRTSTRLLQKKFGQK